MPKGMQAIYTQTIGAGGISSVTFNNIPQTYTDLKLSVSLRENSSGTINQLFIRFNGSSAAKYSRTSFYGYNNSAFTDRTSNQTELGITFTNPGSSTASTFSNNEITIPNYTSTIYKSIIGNGAAESNSLLYASPSLSGGLWSTNSPITSLTVFYSSVVIQQHSTFTLYGIGR
jgi:hypothetical protein